MLTHQNSSISYLFDGREQRKEKKPICDGLRSHVVPFAEGSGSKAEAVQQAARAALEALCGVLDKAAVNQNNHKGALQELLVRFKQPHPEYHVTDSPAGHGDRVTWLPEADPTGGLAEGSGHRYQEVEGADEGAHAEIGTPMKRMITDRSDRPSKMSKVLPSTAGSERPGKEGGVLERRSSNGPYSRSGCLGSFFVSKHQLNPTFSSPTQLAFRSKMAAW